MNKKNSKCKQKQKFIKKKLFSFNQKRNLLKKINYKKLDFFKIKFIIIFKIQ